jgi:serine/threonine protein kinase/Flp pilus assembly protein TadD
MSNADSARKARIAELVEEFLQAEAAGQPLNRAAWLSANEEYRLDLAEFLSRHKPQIRSLPVDTDEAATYLIPSEQTESVADIGTIDGSVESVNDQVAATMIDDGSSGTVGTIAGDGNGQGHSVEFDETIPGKTVDDEPTGTIADEVDGRTQVPDNCDVTMMEAPADGTISEGQIQVDASRIKSTHFRQKLSAKAAASGEQPYNPPALDGDRYELHDFVARGGIGEVWQADDMRLGRRVALKSLRRGRDTMRERFVLEAELTGRLEHPGVVPVYDLALDRNNEPYYVMKFVRGRSMRDMIKAYFWKSKNNRGTSKNVEAVPAENDSRELQFQKLLDSFVSMCETIGYAHERGIIHRDIKPENVMVGAFGETLVLDWGLAKDKTAPEEKLASLSDMHLSSAGAETRAGSVMGSPGYMAPELVEGEAHLADERTDIYLLGASLYEILTGKAPHHSGSLTGMLERARAGTPDPPRAINPSASKILSAICLKAMQKARNDRYLTAMDLARDVRRYLAGEPVSAYQENAFEKSLRWARKNQKALSRMTIAIAVSFVLIFAWSLRTENQKLAAIEMARAEVAEFKKLADEAQYFAATSGRLDDSTPYYDPVVAERVAGDAIRISDAWGDHLEGLPLDGMRSSVKETLYSLLLTTVQSQLNRNMDSELIEKSRSLLARAQALHGKSESLLRLRGALDEATTDDAAVLVAGSDTTMSKGQQVGKTALDYFLNAEELRRQASRSGATDGDEWKAHVELIEQAIAGYRSAIRIRAGDFWSHFQMGRCYLSLGKYSEGVETFGACVALRPESPWPHSARGLALAMLDRFDEAIADLNRAVEIDRAFLPAKLNRGVVHWLAGDRELAESDFTQLLEKSEDSLIAEASYYRAVLRWGDGDQVGALTDLETVRSVRPDFAAAMLLQSRIYFLTGNFERGTSCLNSWLASNAARGGSAATDQSFDPAAWQVCLERARFLRRLLSSAIPTGIELDRKSLLTQAQSELQEAIRQGGNSAELYSETGSVLELFGAADDALAAYSKSLTVKPDNDTLLVKRGWLQVLRLRNGDGAIADFEAALQVNPNNAEAHSAHGFLLALQNPSADAEQAAVRAILHGAGDYLILHNVACIYAELAAASQPDKAAGYEQSALDVLKRGLALWQKGNRSGPDAVQLARGESSFRNLAKREDFKTLLDSAAADTE